MYRLGHRNIRICFYITSAFILYYTCISLQNSSVLVATPLINDYGHFFFIGFIAATVANTTGAGGGIVFIPAFMALGLSPTAALATSFSIQCFGMTSGALSWLSQGRKEISSHPLQWQYFPSIISVSLLGSLLGLWLIQWGAITSPFDTHKLFAIFSLFIALVIFYRTFSLPSLGEGRTDNLTKKEVGLLFISCGISGAITAWISIGVGEVLAIVLLLMGFRVHVAIAAAVCISSLTVLSAVPYHIIVTESIDLNILLFAAPGAIIGGEIARRVATSIGIKPLKLFMATWIAISAVVYLI